MTEEQKEKRKKNYKKWYNLHKEEKLKRNRELYHQQKLKGETWQQRNKDKVKINTHKYIDKKIAELKSQGVKNPYVVLENKGVAKYEVGKR